MKHDEIKVARVETMGSVEPSRTALKRGVPRGRFDVVCVFDSAYARFTSNKTRSMTPAEIVSGLRKCADAIESGGAAEMAANHNCE